MTSTKTPASITDLEATAARAQAELDAAKQAADAVLAEGRARYLTARQAAYVTEYDTVAERRATASQRQAQAVTAIRDAARQDPVWAAVFAWLEAEYDRDGNLLADLAANTGGQRPAPAAAGTLVQPEPTRPMHLLTRIIDDMRPQVGRLDDITQATHARAVTETGYGPDGRPVTG